MTAFLLLAAGILVNADEPKPADRAAVRSILDELRLPPLGPTVGGGTPQLETLPTFAAKTLQRYAAGEPSAELREALAQARAVLWAVSGERAPADLAAASRKLRETNQVIAKLTAVPVRFRVPQPTRQKEFAQQLEGEQRKAARLLLVLEEAADGVKKVAAERAKSPLRWQAHYDYMLARLHLQSAYIYEYSYNLGQMRRELPPLDPMKEGGWFLAPRPFPHAGADIRKLVREAEKRLEQIATDHAGTPWEELARRDRQIPRGLEWQGEP